MPARPEHKLIVFTDGSAIVGCYQKRNNPSTCDNAYYIKDFDFGRSINTLRHGPGEAFEVVKIDGTVLIYEKNVTMMCEANHSDWVN